MSNNDSERESDSESEEQSEMDWHSDPDYRSECKSDTESNYSSAGETESAWAREEESGTEVQLDNSGITPVCVPGLGVGLSYLQENRFCHGNEDWVAPFRLTVKEVAMLQTMDELMDNTHWAERIFDESVVEGWRLNTLERPHMSSAGFEWCIKELRDKAKFYREHKYTLTLDTASRCAKSDELVGEDLLIQLTTLTQPLLESVERYRDPDTDEDDKQVFQLVDPGMYQLVHGRTKILKFGQVELLNATGSCGRGKTIRHRIDDPPDLQKNCKCCRGQYEGMIIDWNPNLQWLPCEVEFMESRGSDVKITSYINNLPARRFQDLYRVIEKVISLAIDPWNDILVKHKWGSGQPRTPPRIKTFGVEFDIESKPDWINRLPSGDDTRLYFTMIGMGAEAETRGPEEKSGEFEFEYDSDEAEEFREDIKRVGEYLEEISNASRTPSPSITEFPDPDGEWVEDLGLQGVAETKYKRLRNVVHPEPSIGYSYEDWFQGNINSAVISGQNSENGQKTHEYYNVSLQDAFRDKGLQVIVKLASIELTPEKPNYESPGWTIEGMLNEHIVATAVYYYDLENLTESRISLRQQAYIDFRDVKTEHMLIRPLKEMFGIERDEQSHGVQEIGSIATPQGRFLAFPNTLEHRVESFTLKDQSKPGHRRWLTLFLVDPNYRIASTRNVPPQQQEWLNEDCPQLDIVRQHLPPELVDMVFKELGKDMMSLERARLFRDKSVRERKVNVRSVQDRHHRNDYLGLDWYNSGY